jgi:hypothetical protein
LHVCAAQASGLSSAHYRERSISDLRGYFSNAPEQVVSQVPEQVVKHVL